MKTAEIKRKVVYSGTILLAIVTAALVAACDSDISEPPHKPPPFTFNIYPIYDTREVIIGVNTEIAGQLVNAENERLDGYRVRFTLNPDTMGIITPWATLEKDSSNGFLEEVTFMGIKVGVVLINGTVLKPDGSSLVQDTLSLMVRNPINS